MQTSPKIIDLLSQSLSRFADGWRTWGLLAAVIGAALFAFTLAIVGAAAVVGLIAGVSAEDPSSSMSPVALAVLTLGVIAATAIWTVCWQLVFAGILRLSFRELDHGTPPALGDLLGLALTDALPVLALTLFTLVVSVAGLCLCVLPGLLAGAALVWALPLVIDQGMDPLSAMRESVRQFGLRPWWTLGFALLGTGMMVVLGQVLPIVGPGVGQILYALYLVRGYRAVFPAQA